METEERTYPVSRLTADVVAVANTSKSDSRDADPKSTEPALPTNAKKGRFNLSEVLKEIIKAFSRSSEANQYDFFVRSSEKDDAESD